MDDIWQKAAKKLCTHDLLDTRVKQSLNRPTTSTKTPTSHQTVSPPSWCNPETVTLEQIDENTRRLLREWLKDNGIPFPREILKILQDLKSKVRVQDEKRAQVPVSLKPANLPAEGPEIVTTTSEKVEREEGDERAGDTNDVIMMSWSTDHLHSTMNNQPYSPTTIPNTPTHAPQDLSTLRSGIQNPWDTLSHHHHCHHHPQLPCSSSTPNSAKRATWNSACHPHRRCYPPHPPLPHFNPPSHPMPVYIIETVHHSQGITPMKLIIRTTSPAPTPIGVFETVQHPHGISPTKLKFTKKIPINSKKHQKNIQSACHACDNVIQPERVTDKSPPTRTLPPVRILETVRHPHRIGPSKPVIRVPWAEMPTSAHPTQLDWATVRSEPPSHPAGPVQRHHGQLVPVLGIHSIPLLQSLSTFISHFSTLPPLLPGQFLSLFAPS